MEPSFGADFSGVRIHTDAESLNRSLNARAFTTGQDIFFSRDSYKPGTSSGRELLAHELTHVVRRNGEKVHRRMAVSPPGDRHEVEADRMAQAVMHREQEAVEPARGHQNERRRRKEEEVGTPNSRPTESRGRRKNYSRHRERTCRVSGTSHADVLADS